jgi:hypothetical protein
MRAVPGSGNVASVRLTIPPSGSRPMATRWPGAQQPQAGARQGGGAEGGDGAVVEEHAARPGRGVVTADRGLHRRLLPGRWRERGQGSQRSPGRLRSAVWMIRSHSCGGGSPVASHMSGNADADVIPGMVLISLRMIRPSGV